MARGKPTHSPVDHQVQSRSNLTYVVWYNLRLRCTDPEHPQYADYGGRGITVCDRWRQSYAAFLKDMGPRPSKKVTLDRIDNDGPYSPENCRWASKAQQNRNQRTNRMITWRGETKCLADWADITGIPHTTIWARLDVLKWPVEKAMTVPIQKQIRFSKNLTLERLAELRQEHGSWKAVAAFIGCIPQALLRFRRRHGLPVRYRRDSPHPRQ